MSLAKDLKGRFIVTPVSEVKHNPLSASDDYSLVLLFSLPSHFF
jgi:hypothetical protein